MTTRTLADPDLDTTAAFVTDARSDALAVSLVGPCTAAFEGHGGRAERELPAGVRQVLWKPDGTVVVHAAAGRDPDAWASGGSVSVRVADDALELRCGDGDAADALTVRFTSVQAATAFDPASETASVEGTESDL